MQHYLLAMERRNDFDLRSVSECGQHSCQFADADRLRLGIDRVLSAGGIDHKGAVRFEILAGTIESLLRSPRQTALDLDCPKAMAGNLQHQVDLGASSGPIETG